MPIPKIIHFIWIQGESKIPKHLMDFYTGCKNINNDFKFMFWDEDKIIEFLKKNFDKKYLDLYLKYKVMAQKADFARYVIVYTYGGIYLDIDTFCKKNMTPLLQYQFFYSEPITILGFNKNIVNAVFGSIKGHPIFKIIFRLMLEREDRIDDVVYSTGPGLLYDAIEEYKKVPEPKISINSLDKKFIDPCSIFVGEKVCTKVCKDCFTVNMANVSWSKKLQYVIWIRDNLNTFLLIIISLIIILFLLIGIF